MSQEYDVFADLYDDKEEKAKFLETLKSGSTNDFGNVSSDEDDLLPPNLQMKNRGRGKKAKSPPPPASKKENALKDKDVGGKKAKKSQRTGISEAQQSTASAVETAITSDLFSQPMTRSRATRSNISATLTQPTTSTSTITRSISTSNSAGAVRGRRGRRGGRNSSPAISPSTIPPSLLAPENTMSLADSLNIFAAMMAGARGRRRVMRARRTYFAEIAARAANVDYVDLVSSPLPNISGVVTVDSDAEEDSRSSNSVELTGTEEEPAIAAASTSSLSVLNNNLECSFDEDNPEVSVKIKWNGESPEIFKLRKYQKFHKIFDEIANRENTPIDSLVFNIDNRIISANDTPASINYKIYEFISGRVLNDLFELGSGRKKRDANVITLKIQSDLWPKKPLKVELNKTDKLKILYIKCAEELKMAVDDLVLSFNGDHLGFNDTPEDFELENDEAVDLRLKKK